MKIISLDTRRDGLSHQNHGSLFLDSTVVLLGFLTASHPLKEKLGCHYREQQWLVWPGWLEYCPVNQKVMGSILCLCTSLRCRFGPLLGHVQEEADQCFLLTSVFLSPLSNQ